MHSKVQINIQVTKEPPALLADCIIASVLKKKITPQKVRHIIENRIFFFTMIIYFLGTRL